MIKLPRRSCRERAFRDGKKEARPRPWALAAGFVTGAAWSPAPADRAGFQPPGVPVPSRVTLGELCNLWAPRLPFLEAGACWDEAP